MFSTFKPWTNAGIFAGILLIAPLGVIAKTQMPEHYAMNSTAKYDASEVQLSYVGLAGALYSNALGSALSLSKAIEAQHEAPNDANLAGARAAWTNARNAYLATEAFRFYGGPIDGPKTERSAAGPELAINTNFRQIKRALWAAKVSSDARQREALVKAAAALQSDLTFVLKEWDPIRRTGYAQAFLQMQGSEAIGRILRGLAMQAQALSKDARGSDVNAILAGMHSIWHAQLNNITAPSVAALLTKIDANAATEVSNTLASAQTQAAAKDAALPTTLQKLGDAISHAASRLGVAINTK